MRRFGQWVSASLVLAAFSGWLLCGTEGTWQDVGSSAVRQGMAPGVGHAEMVAKAGLPRERGAFDATAEAEADPRGEFGPPARADEGRGAGGAGAGTRGGEPSEGDIQESGSSELAAREVGLSEDALAKAEASDSDAESDPAELAALEEGLGAGGALAKATIPDPGGADAASSSTGKDESSSDATFSEAQGRLLSWNVSNEEKGSYPWIAGEVGAELEYFSYFAASESEYERDNWLTNVHLEQTLNLSDEISVHNQFRGVLESDGEDERFWSDWPYEGVYLVELLARYDTDHVSVFGGKYEPAGHKRGYAPIFFGNYTRNLVLFRRLGGGASATLDSEAVGEHTLTGHLFRMDDTRLRGELISNQWREDEFLESAGELGWPSSYLLTLDGKPPVGDALELSYTVGAGEQTRGERPDERILLAALLGKVPIDDVGTLYASIDLLDLRNAGGYHEDRKVLEPGIGIATPSYYVGAAYSQRHANPREGEPRVDRITEVVGRYYLTQRSTIEAAYQHVREWGSVENAFGISATYWADWIVH